ncbi:MAG: electron transfer flavoprotein subunit beta/FixA family protein [Deltaproteobacteria bacterium]|nr:electron transfer flavoprotein subunit beta/FixA family protein [Deltaproteobacteria bacterium]
MNIVVCVKQTFDTEAKIVLDEAGGISEQSVLQIMNPSDEYAVEEGIRLKEKYGGQVTVVTVGDDAAVKSLQQALAMGADHAVLVSDSRLKMSDSHGIAAALSRVLGRMEYDIILCGRLSVDGANAEVPGRLAERLDLPQVSLVSKLQVTAEGKVDARRDIEGGVEIVETHLPAVITVQKGINEVRYPSLRLTMQARKMPIRKLGLDDLELTPEDVAPLGRIEGYIFPPPRKQGRTLTGPLPEIIPEVIRFLYEEQKIL